jgi:hypothetical protein
MMLLAVMLAVNAALHAIIIARHGIKGNEPPAAFGVLYAVLALAAFAGSTWVPSAAVLVTAIGLLGLAINFRKLTHDTMIEKIIFGVGAAVILVAAYLLL